MEKTQVHILNFSGIYESRRIILSKYTHFLTLSLFFIPLSLYLITIPTLKDHFSNHQKHVTYYLLYILLVDVFALCAIGTIIYSTHHAFFGKPVMILDTLKSLIFSFLPLASTAIVAYVLLVLISLTFIVFVGTMVMLLHKIGFDFDYNSVYFLAIMGVVLITILIYFQVNWSLAFVVVVVESKWGFAALKRSSYLVKGVRSVSLFLKVYFVYVTACTVAIGYANVMVLTMLGSIFIAVFMLRITAANTVFYNHCKVLHGELTLDAAVGFGYDLVDLDSDDKKVPHVDIVVAA